MKTNLDRYSEIDREAEVLEAQIGPLSDFGRDEKNLRFINLMSGIEKLRREKKQLYEKLKKAEEEYNSRQTTMEGFRLQIQQLKQENVNLINNMANFHAVQYERDQLKEELDLERSKKGKYTKFGGGHRANSCEFEVHGSKCEHGDCDCPCHDEIEQLSERVNGLLSLIEIHKNEKKQLEEENKRLGRFRTEHGIHELEVELQNIKNKIKYHVEVRAGETVFQVWRRELLEMIK